jgi:hypothetical protein
MAGKSGRMKNEHSKVVTWKIGEPKGSDGSRLGDAIAALPKPKKARK